MVSSITKGNAIIDGRDFSYWFIGHIEKWCREHNIPFDKEKVGLRDSKGLEIKWGIYKQGEERAEWAECSDRTAMSILVRGDLIFNFRNPHDRSECKEVRLQKEGDYVIWPEVVQHTWKMEQDSVILTLRWVC